MRLAIAAVPPATSTTTPDADPAVPNLAFLARDPAAALRSFFDTVAAVVTDNPVDLPRLELLAAKARLGDADASELGELQRVTVQAVRQGRAVAAVIGFFLKLRPNAMLDEIRRRGKLFQPAFGPVLVVEGDAVREVLERNQEFTVDPYGTEMVKVMSPRHNDGFTTFVLSTDDNALYEPDRRLLDAVCRPADAQAVVDIVHRDCVRRMGQALATARATGATTIDLVPALARYVPVTLGHRYLGVPVAETRGTFELTPEMLACYGSPIEGQAETALGKDDGVIPDEQQMYLWIKAAFQHFFNNVQKDPGVQARGLRACRQLLAYLLREIAIQRQRFQDGLPVEDTMLTRLLAFQMGRAVAAATPPPDLDPRLVSDLRIAENVMGTIVGAVAGQEEATCRVIDSMLRLKEGEYQTTGSGHVRREYGTFEEARRLSVNVMSGTNARDSRARLYKYCVEALRLQPQGEVLLRRCARDGTRVAGSRAMAAGTMVFAAHGSAMRDVPEPAAFMLDRPREHYLHYGWSRHTCLGQHVSPVIIVESMAAVLALQDLARPEPREGETAFPLDRRFGRLQFDENNLYATSFSVGFADSGTTQLFWPASSAAGHEVM